MKMAENARPSGAQSNWKVYWMWLVASRVSLSFLHSCKNLVFSAANLSWSAHSHFFYTHSWSRDGHQPFTDWISEHWRAFVCWWEEKFFLPNWILIRKPVLGTVAIIWVSQGADLMVKPGRQGQKKYRKKKLNALWISGSNYTWSWVTLFIYVNQCTPVWVGFSVTCSKNVIM